jgi:hypothetical protein
MLAHASRQPYAWLIFNVGQKMIPIYVTCYVLVLFFMYRYVDIKKLGYTTMILSQLVPGIVAIAAIWVMICVPTVRQFAGDSEVLQARWSILVQMFLPLWFMSAAASLISTGITLICAFVARYRPWLIVGGFSSGTSIFAFIVILKIAPTA